MKKIEPGCLCAIINSGVPENNFRQVTAMNLVVGSSIPYFSPIGYRVFTVPGERYWEVEGDLVYITTKDPQPRKTSFGLVRESRLLRIDGHEPEQATEQKKEVSTC